MANVPSRPAISAPSLRPKKRTTIVVGAVCVLAVAVVAGGLFFLNQREADVSEPASDTVTPGLVQDQSAGAIKPTEDVVRSEVTLAVTAPDGATQMQIGFDPSFRSTEWQPVIGNVALASNNTGYQTIFAQFADESGAELSTVTTGVVVDPTFDAATSGDEGTKSPSWARPLSADVVVVRLEDGRVDSGGVENYNFDEPLDGDEVVDQGGELRVLRNGELYGVQTSERSSMLRKFDTIAGTPMTVEDIENLSWVVTADNGTQRDVVEISRYARLAGIAEVGPDDRSTLTTHDVALRLGQPLVEGVGYTVEANSDRIATASFVYKTDQVVSPAVHANQVGYSPSAESKIAFLGGRLDGVAAVDYSDVSTFSVRSVDSGDEVFTGEIVERTSSDEIGKGDLTGTSTFEMDFSTLTDPGQYQVCVAGVGCSYPFVLTDLLWQDLAVQVARASYHQRSGVSLGEPFSPIVRPRPYHPDDGMTVFSSDYTLLDSLNEPLEDVFANLVEGGTSERVPEAWGGHFDAGDWDRRIQHLWYTRMTLDLVELYPEIYADLDVNIPESGDGIPDLLDEGLWSLDAFGRMQTSDGGIRGGIEAEAHPADNDTSWTESLAVFAYSPDPWSSYVYAGVAAQAASVLQLYDAEKAKGYEESALRAMAWAEAQPTHPTKDDLVQGQRSVAAAALFKLTGEERWHQLFRETFSLESVDPSMSCHARQRCDAAWIYLTTPTEMTDATVREPIFEAFVASTDDVVEGVESTDYRWAIENRNIPLVWGLGAGGNPSSVGLLRAYELTGDVRYRNAAVQSASFTLGANPLNRVFITGLGAEPVQHPLIIDRSHGGLPVWPGTPVYGLHTIDPDSDGWIQEFFVGPGGASPGVENVPYLWQWQDSPNMAVFTEFTLHQSHAATLYAFGALAATDG